jgi:hypothetical protein
VDETGERRSASGEFGLEVDRLGCLLPTGVDPEITPGLASMELLECLLPCLFLSCLEMLLLEPRAGTHKRTDHPKIELD